MKYSYETALTAALAELETAQRLLAKEITSYPAPISGCDAQFNRLLSDRVRIRNTLSAIHSQPFVPTSRELESASTT